MANLPNFQYKNLGGSKINLKNFLGPIRNSFTLRKLEFMTKIWKKALLGHSKILGGPKMAHGTCVGYSCPFGMTKSAN
jgi:hypothetical protein